MIAEIESLWRPGWDAECDVWEEQALDAARRLDDGPATTHVAPLNRLKNEALRELRRLMTKQAPPSGDEGAVPVRDDFVDWVGTTHTSSAMCQPSWPVVAPGQCTFCDAAARLGRTQNGG
ncbi:hypothetical protein [Arthrobacter sp. B3I4]|uniref:hypothetical protein n=1 Tax=Arthrobacter sp. B3I4 TaxID=3042267 RepID=UPI0027D8CC35|nr:hypothetical protein [Arthrobacter sp. B3I4]